jgi:hypothetical protein
MKAYQFFIIACLLMSITSNVEDNHAMKVFWGVMSSSFGGMGFALGLQEIHKFYKEQK